MNPDQIKKIRFKYPWYPITRINAIGQYAINKFESGLLVVTPQGDIDIHPSITNHVAKTHGHDESVLVTVYTDQPQEDNYTRIAQELNTAAEELALPQ